jgi:hypothetical protein
MNSRFIGLAVLSACILTSPLRSVAAGQPARLRAAEKTGARKNADATRALQQGKGTGMSLNRVVNRPDTGHSAAVRANAGNPAFTR